MASPECGTAAAAAVQAAPAQAGLPCPIFPTSTADVVTLQKTAHVGVLDDPASILHALMLANGMQTAEEKLSHLTAALHLDVKQNYRRKLLRQILWGSIYRLQKQLHPAHSKHVLLAGLREKLCSPSGFTAQNLQQLHTEWLRICPLLQNATDDCSWAMFAIQVSAEQFGKALNCDKMIALAKRQASWRGLEPNAKYSFWCSCMLHSATAAQVHEACDAADLEAVKLEPTQSSALAAVQNATAQREQDAAAQPSDRSPPAVDSPSAAVAESELLLRSWHGSTRTLLCSTDTALWAGIHKGELLRQETASSLHIASIALAKWSFYAVHSQCAFAGGDVTASADAAGGSVATAFHQQVDRALAVLQLPAGATASHHKDADGSKLLDQITEQAALCARMLGAGKHLAPASAGCLTTLNTAVCSAFFDGVPTSTLKRALKSVTPVFAAATQRAAGATSEEWISQLAVLAYHILLVQTKYGIALPLTPAACLQLVGMEEACAMLQAHGIISRQPERFLEGLIVLQLCGHNTSQLLLDWHGKMVKAPPVGAASLYPSVLQQALLPVAKSAARHLRSAQQLAHTSHWSIVLCMYAAVVKVRFDFSGPGPAAPLVAEESSDEEPAEEILTSAESLPRVKRAHAAAVEQSQSKQRSLRAQRRGSPPGFDDHPSPSHCVEIDVNERQDPIPAPQQSSQQAESGMEEEEEKEKEERPTSPLDLNDDVCAICSKVGKLVCCTRCPRSYHKKCLSEEEQHALRRQPEHSRSCTHLGLSCSERKKPIRAGAPLPVQQSEEPVSMDLEEAKEEADNPEETDEEAEETRAIVSPWEPSPSDQRARDEKAFSVLHISSSSLAALLSLEDEQPPSSDAPMGAACSDSFQRSQERVSGYDGIVAQVELLDPLQCFLPLNEHVLSLLYGDRETPHAVVFTLHWKDRQKLEQLIRLHELRSQQFRKEHETVLWPMTLGCINDNGRPTAMSPEEVEAAQHRTHAQEAGVYKPCPSSESVLHFIEQDAAAFFANRPRPKAPESMRDVVYAKDVSFDKICSKKSKNGGFFQEEDERLAAFFNAEATSSALEGSELAFHAHRQRLRARWRQVNSQLLAQFHPLNLNQSPLHRRSLANLAAVDFEGVTSSYLYVKAGFQFFNLHVEQLLFTFLHYQATGSSEWIIIQAGQIDKLDKLAASCFKQLWPETAEKLEPAQLLLIARTLLFSKVMFPSTDQLHEHKIRFRKELLAEGRCFLARGDLAHCGFSTSSGRTISLACNFVSEESLDNTLVFLVEHLMWIGRLRNFLETPLGKDWRNNKKPAAGAPGLPLPAELLRKAAFFAPCNFTCSWLRGLLADLQLVIHPAGDLKPLCEYPTLDALALQGDTRRAMQLVSFCRAALTLLHKGHWFLTSLDATPCAACEEPTANSKHECMMCICPSLGCEQEEWTDPTGAAAGPNAASSSAGDHKRKSGGAACAAAAASSSCRQAKKKRKTAQGNTARSDAAASDGSAAGEADAPEGIDNRASRVAQQPAGMHSSSLNDDAAALRLRLQRDGYLLLRDALPVDQVQKARDAFFELLQGRQLKLLDKAATAGEPTASRAKKGVAHAWDALTGVRASSSTVDEKAKEIGVSTAMSALYEQGVNAVCSALCKGTSVQEGTLFSLLPEMTWMRAVLPGGSTAAHSDVGFFLRRTDRLCELYAQLQPALQKDPAQCGKNMCCGSANSPLYQCSHCRRSFHPECQVALSSWLRDKLSMARWHCDECLDAPTPFYTCWMPLLDLTRKSSRLQVLPGSHRDVQGYTRMQGVGHGDELPEGYNAAQHKDKWLTAPADMKAGDLILFNWKLIHAAGKHEDNRLRLSVDTRVAIYAFSAV